MLNKIEILEKIVWERKKPLRIQTEDCEFVKRRCPRIDDDGPAPEESPNDSDVECVNIYRVIGADFNETTTNGPTKTSIRFSCESREESASGGNNDGPCPEPPNDPKTTVFRVSNCLENNDGSNEDNNLEGCFKFCVVVK